MNEDWDALRLFLAVAREGGLSPAAKVTGSSPATLGRRMLKLERHLGIDLFHRHDRGYELTTEGRELASRLAPVEGQIARLLKPKDRLNKPLIKLSAGTWSALALMSRITDIVGTPQDLRLRILSDEQNLSITNREIHLGIRNKKPVQDNLAGQKLPPVHFAPYATAKAPDRWIGVLADTPSARWVKKKVGRDAICEVTSPRNSLDLALAGLGIAVLPTFIGDTQDGLKRVGQIIPELSHDQWLTMHQDDRHLPEIRRAIDRIRTILQSTA